MRRRRRSNRLLRITTLIRGGHVNWPSSISSRSRYSQSFWTNLAPHSPGESLRRRPRYADMPQKTAMSIGDRLRIVVLGYIVRGPIGGLAWHHLQYVMGLAELGHDVRFLEDSGDTPWCCYDPSRDLTDSNLTYGLKFAAAAFSFCGLPEHWAYRDAHTDRWFGPSASRVQAICNDADLVLNL